MKFWAHVVIFVNTVCVLGPLPAAAQNAFYQASESDIAGPVGSLIREEPRSGAAADATAHKVLYRSTKPDSTPIAVSGIVIVPAGQAPAGGWPIVAWAHPTTGVVPRCAPSLAIFLFQQIAGSRRLLEDGYAIAATDYPGLGTPGPHPYLVGESEARAVIDSVRAARLFPGLENSNRFAVWGHSQGGQASLFTGMIAKTYAPELQLVGVAAAAPATDLATLVRPAVTHAYMQRLCKAGSMVKMLDLPNVSHGFAGYDSADAAVDWIADRFGGRAKPNDC
jgi:hypothetical protein